MASFYAYYQWYYNIPSSEVIEKVPLNFLMKAYHGLHDLELDLAVKKGRCSIKWIFYVFDNPDEENGYLSNWYMSQFDVNGIGFSSMEQYMMYKKAVCFRDDVIAEKILETDEVGSIKELGRMVAGYNENYWNGIRQIVVYEGL